MFDASRVSRGKDGSNYFGARVIKLPWSKEILEFVKVTYEFEVKERSLPVKLVKDELLISTWKLE